MENRKEMAWTQTMYLEAWEKDAEVDPIDWLVMADIFANIGEEEAAYQGFELAHLLDHQKLDTNSELGFSTIGEKFS